MILIDEARWPAHGTVFAHLVSDASLDELLDFARVTDLPPGAFDHDHYDVPARRHDDLVAAGAVRVESTELLRRLRASGLRVPPRDRTPKRPAVLPGLRAAWSALLPERPELGVQLLELWSAPGRNYHDVRHLQHVLASLDAAGAPPRTVRLAAWFHDAIYTGVPGEDEEASARLASDLLAGALPQAEVDEVARLVRLTARHETDADDLAGQHLIDADLAILGTLPGRYVTYARDVRLDYAHLDDAAFSAGRHRVLEGLLGRRHLYASDEARRRWEEPARANLRHEHGRTQQGGNYFALRPRMRG